MKSNSENNSWLIRKKTSAENRFRLFCFPYAGGGASVFRQWQDELPADIEVCPVQFPGRENRICEQPFSELSSLVRTLSEELTPSFDLPFAFFGHSVGAKVAFELARELGRRQEACPIHLFVAGSRAPHIPEPRPLHMLPDEEMIRELRRYSGTPEAIFENKDLMNLYLPMLRADFSLDETYMYYEDTPLTCPVTAFGGTEDNEANQEELNAWIGYTKKDFNLQMFPGDHFFINSSRSLLLNAIAENILSKVV